MTSKEYIKELDWSAVIATATQELDTNCQVQSSNTQGQVANSQILKAEYYLNRGIARLFSGGKDGKYKEAIEDLSNAIVQGLNNNQVYYYRAYAFFLDGNYEKAIQDCHKITCKCSAKPEDCKPKDGSNTSSEGAANQEGDSITPSEGTEKQEGDSKNTPEDAAKQEDNKTTCKCSAKPEGCKPEQCSCSCGKKVCPHSHELLGKIYMAISDYPKAVRAFSAAMKLYAPRCFPPGLMDLYREACRKMNSQG